MTFAYEKVQSIWTLYYILRQWPCFKLLLLCTFNLKYSSKGLHLGPSPLISFTRIYLYVFYLLIFPQLTHEPPIQLPLLLTKLFSPLNELIWPFLFSWLHCYLLRNYCQPPYLLRSLSYGHDSNKEPRCLGRRVGVGVIHGNVNWEGTCTGECDATGFQDTQGKWRCDCEWLSVCPKADFSLQYI